MSTTAPQPPDQASDDSGAQWPLKFRSHYFGGHCFNTQSCRILYRGFPHGSEQPSPSVESYGRPLEKLLSAGRGPIPNFPPPAKVSWQAQDGTPLEAEIDIGEIFKDELIRHNVAREDATKNATDALPEIVVEVNDRTINVYMRATIWLKEPRIPGNRYSTAQRDLIKAFSRTF